MVKLIVDEIVETNLHDTFLFHFYTKELTYNTY